MSHKRVKDALFVRPIIYGSYSQLLKPGEARNDPTHLYRWSVFVKGHNGEDISTFVKKVTFQLHESFQNPERVVETAPFEVQETGWGEFEIQCKIHFQDPQEKPVQFFFQLVLHPRSLKPGVELKEDPDRALVSEYYEELIFFEPTEEMAEIFTANAPIERAPHPAPKIPGYSGSATTFDATLERKELAKLDRALDAVRDQTTQARAKLERLTAQHQQQTAAK